MARNDSYIVELKEMRKILYFLSSAFLPTANDLPMRKRTPKLFVCALNRTQKPSFSCSHIVMMSSLPVVQLSAVLSLPFIRDHIRSWSGSQLLFILTGNILELLKYDAHRSHSHTPYTCTQIPPETLTSSSLLEVPATKRRSINELYKKNCS